MQNTIPLFQSRNTENQTNFMLDLRRFRLTTSHPPWFCHQTQTTLDPAWKLTSIIPC